MQRFYRIVVGIGVLTVPVCLILLRITFGLIQIPEMRFLPTEGTLMGLGEELRPMLNSSLARQPLLLPRDLAGGARATRIKFRWTQTGGLGAFSTAPLPMLRDSLNVHFSNLRRHRSLQGARHMLGYQISVDSTVWLVNGQLDATDSSWIFAGYLTRRDAFFLDYAPRWFNQYLNETQLGARLARWKAFPIAVLLVDDKEGHVETLWQGSVPPEGQTKQFEEPFLLYVPGARLMIRSNYLVDRSYTSLATQLLVIGLVAWVAVVVLLLRAVYVETERNRRRTE